jgi:hypothetical protein
MTQIRIILADQDGVRPYVNGLRSLEHDILYPIADGKDHFRIDHGPEYTPFFTGLGDAHFAIALEGEEVVGNAVGIIRSALHGDRSIVTGYACDYKIAARLRGKGLSRRMLMFGLRQMFHPKNSRFRSWRFGYGATMRGEKGDVLHSGKGVHPLKLMAPYARLLIYFVAPGKLASLQLDGAPPPPARIGLDLSPRAEEASAPLGIVSTGGRKDLRLVSTNAPWPLQHFVLGPRAWMPALGFRLRAVGEALVGAGQPGPVCFSIDDRLGDQVAWLKAQGVEPGATCALIAWRLLPRIGTPAWVHLATSEI